MSFSINHLGDFKRGQFDITEDCKSNCDSGKIVSIFDGDVITSLYEKTKFFRFDELQEFVSGAYGDGYDRFLATYSEDEEGNISVYFEGSVENSIDDIESICFYDEDGEEEFWEIYTGDRSRLLVTSAYMSKDDVIQNQPYLKLIKNKRTNMKNVFIISWNNKTPLGFDFTGDIFEIKEEAEREIKDSYWDDGISYTIREVSDVFIYLYEYLDNTTNLTAFPDNKADLEKVYDFFENVTNETLVRKYLDEALNAEDCVLDRKKWIEKEMENLAFWLK